MRAPYLPVLLLPAALVVAASAHASGVRPPDDASPAPLVTIAAPPSPVGIVQLVDADAVLVTRRDPLSPEPGPTVRNGQRFVIRCQINGARKDGAFGASKVWDQVQLPTGEIAYLPDALTQTSTKDVLVAPYCGAPAPSRVGGTQGQCGLRSPVRLLRAPRSRAAFLRVAGPDARRSFRSTGVPASVTLAQAILESGDGRATAGANNFFGIKAQLVDPASVTFRWGRQAVGCLHQPTVESEAGTDVRQVAQFRLYRTRRASFVDHGRFLRDEPRYRRAFRHGREPRRFAQELQRAGYATDPGYSAKLVRIIREERLTRWDPRP